MVLDYYMYSYIDFYAATFTLSALFVLLVKKAYISYSGRQLILMTVIVTSLLIIEGISYLVNGRTFSFAYEINYIGNFILFFLTPLIVGLWAMYVHYKIYKYVPSNTVSFLYFTPFFISAVLMILNVFTPLMFYIDDINIYHRGIGVYINSGMIYTVFMFVLILTFTQKKSITNYEFYSLLLFGLIPAFGGLLQVIHKHNITMYPMMALGIVLAYNLFETVGTSVDSMTKAFNREKLYEYLTHNILKKQEFSIVVLDMDNLKEINDQHGHSVGDSCIIHLATSVKKVFDGNGLLARVGGDEFVIVSLETNESSLKKKIFEVKMISNRLGGLPEIKFSFGIAKYNPDSKDNMDDLLHKADQQMYMDKAINKNYRRRSSDIKKSN